MATPCILCSQGTTPRHYAVTFNDGAPALNDVVLCPACVEFLERHDKRVVPVAGA